MSGLDPHFLHNIEQANLHNLIHGQQKLKSNLASLLICLGRFIFSLLDDHHLAMISIKTRSVADMVSVTCVEETGELSITHHVTTCASFTLFSNHFETKFLPLK